MTGKPPGWKPRLPVEIPKTELGSQKARVQAQVDDWDTLIIQQGVRLKIFRTMLCPNVKSLDSAEHNIDCKLCQGNGFVDLRPVLTMGYIQSQALEKVHRAEGYWDGNTASLTLLNGFELQYFALMELPDHTDIFYQRIKRQRGAVDVLKYRALKVNVVLDAVGKEYFPGNDFNLDANGSIRWIVDRGPAPEVIYSIHYEHNIQYRAIKAMHVNRFAQDGRKSPNIKMVKMGEQWMVQREFLVKRKDFNGDALTENLIRKSDSDDGA